MILYRSQYDTILLVALVIPYDGDRSQEHLLVALTIVPYDRNRSIQRSPYNDGDRYGAVLVALGILDTKISIYWRCDQLDAEMLDEHECFIV